MTLLILIIVAVVVAIAIFASAGQDYTTPEALIDRMRAEDRMHRIRWEMKVSRARREIDALFEDD